MFDEPIGLSFDVLDLSKLQLYELYYNKLQTNYWKDNLKLLYMHKGYFIDSFGPVSGSAINQLIM